MQPNDRYDPAVLRKLQLAQCTILEDFIKICEDNDLRYFIFAGCSIGVERHHGFIPWDDDIDIGMLRADYDKFLEIAKRDWTDKYRVLDINIDPDFPFYNAEFIRKGTKNLPVIFKDSKVDMGIDVAIYPFDNVADNRFIRFMQCSGAFIWHKIRILKEFRSPVIFADGVKRKFIEAVCRVIHRILVTVKFPAKFINKRYMRWATMCNKMKTKGVTCFFATKPLNDYIELKDLYPPVKKPFEYLTVCVPGNNHLHLTRKFGDYMQIPPESKRKNHVPYVLEFGPFEDLDINDEKFRPILPDTSMIRDGE